MKNTRLIALATLVVAIMMVVSQSAGVGAETTPQQPAAQPGSDFSAKLNHPTDQSPYLITFQGRLTDHSGNPITSAVNLTFRLYTVSSGGIAIFTEGPISVTPNAQGLLTYQVGSTVVISSALIAQFASTLYLGVTVASDAEMTPRLPLTAAPYAMSLAPGASVSGSVSTGSPAPVGVLNVTNFNRTRNSNVGLFASGATAIWGVANSTGGTDGNGAAIINQGGGSGYQYGVNVSSASFGGAGSAAGLFDNVGGSGIQTGISVINNSRSGTVGFGASIANFGGGSDYQYGIFASVASTATLPSIAGDFANNGGGNNLQYGVLATTASTSTLPSFAGDFTNYGGGNNLQYGMYASTASTSTLPSISGYFTNTGSAAAARYGVLAESNGVGVAGNGLGSNSIGGNFTGATGLAAEGGGAAPAIYAGDGLDVNSAASSPSYAIYSSSPADDSDFTLYGLAHIHGSNVAAASYEVEVVYHGTSPAQLGDVLALDGNNEATAGSPVLGVTRADADNVDMAVGVLSYRLTTQQQGKEQRTAIDGAATSIAPGDHAYITVAGSVRMKVAGATFGQKLAIAGDGRAKVAAKGDSNIIGKVASQPDKDGYVTVFVNMK